jgi:two-component system chemotaxis sensor kinase CheA
MDDMHEIVQEFLVESTENLDQLDRDLLALEVDPESTEILGSAFRTIHTIKGTSGFLAFNRLEQLTHTGESLLSRLRDGVQTMNTSTADALLLMVDTVRELLACIEESGNEGDVAVEPVMERLRAEVRDDSAPVNSIHDIAEPPSIGTTEAAATQGVEQAEPEVASTVAVPEPAAPTEEPALSPAAKSARPVETKQLKSAPADGPTEERQSTSKRSVAESSLRVDVDVLDALMRLAGELVLTRNQLIRGVASLSDPALTRTAQRLNVITTDLQESIMKTRMQPIDHLWSKLPRVVRDLGAQCGRRVRLDMIGQDTELDRTLLEAIKDPLTHLVRNAVDHGIEAPVDREAAGKPGEGTLTLRAYHNSGQVVVEVADDGAGIDPARIRAKAIERGIRNASQAAEMSDDEILQLVFQPGFSTAAAVTNVSGRGVGMDVVKTNIEAIGGAIEIESSPGSGTTCRLRVPLTLAIVPALTVECGAGRYAVPQVSLLELLSLDSDQVATRIEEVAGAPVYRLRGSLLPLIDLADVLGVDKSETQTSIVIAVLQAGGRRFGLLVDRVVNTEEIVVKALSARLKGIGVYSGATILGDGRVALILDVQALAKRALRTDVADRAAQAQAHAAAAATEREPERLLIAGIGEGRQVAIPMSMVTRLELISANSIQRVGSREVVRYRGEIVPLLRLDQHLGEYSASERTELPVAVYSREGHSVAIVMDEIIDIVENDSAVRSDIDDRGLIGSVVAKDKIIGLLDVEQAILAADPDFFAIEPTEPAESYEVNPVHTNGHKPNLGQLVSAVAS